MGRGQAATMTVARRVAAARRCGFELYHPAVSCAEVERVIASSGAAMLDEVERGAWATLSPAVWAVNFRHGWADAEQAVSDAELR